MTINFSSDFDVPTVDAGDLLIDSVSLMKTINKADQTTFIFSTHDRRVTEHADRLITLEDGAITSANTSVATETLSENIA